MSDEVFDRMAQGRQAYRGNIFDNFERLVLDDCVFEHCNFRRCTLIYNGERPVLTIDCSFDLSQLRFEFGQGAHRTLTFLSELYGLGAGRLIEETFQRVRAGEYRGGMPPSKPIPRVAPDVNPRARRSPAQRSDRDQLISDLYLQRDVFITSLFGVGRLVIDGPEELIRRPMHLQFGLGDRPGMGVIGPELVIATLRNHDNTLAVREEHGSAMKRGLILIVVEMIRDYCQEHDRRDLYNNENVLRFARKLRDLSAHHEPGKPLRMPKEWPDPIQWRHRKIGSATTYGGFDWEVAEALLLFEDIVALVREKFPAGATPEDTQ